MINTVEKQTVQPPDITNKEALYYMAQDYLDSLHGKIKTEELGHHTEEQLSDLRRSMAAFSILHDIELSEAALAINTSAEQLEEDLSRDKVLSEIAQEYVERVQQGDIDTVDKSGARIVQMPSMTGQEALNALLRLGFEKVRTTGSHVQIRRKNEDGSYTKTRLPVKPGHDIATGLLESIVVRQAGVSREDFVDAL